MAETMPIRRQAPGEEPLEDMESSFRNSLDDAVALISALGKSCPATADMVEVLRLGLTSGSQLRFLMNLLQQLPQEKRR